MAENLKELWPGWQTVEQIGEGSFGSVYKIGRQIQNATEYAALKVISIPKSDGEIRQLREQGYDKASLTEEFTERLYKIQNEYALLAQMKGCANVVFCEDIRTIQQSNGIGWNIFIKMELLRPLRRALPVQITEKQVIRLGMDVCNALTYCQRLGVIHRDIKPENIFVTEDGKLYKLGDFGIARTMEHTTMGTKTGTYEYMAPEIYNNQPYNATADIYSLGMVLYWMLNDRAMPFYPQGKGRVTMDQRSAARNRRFSGEPIPAPAHGSEELKRIVLKACAFDPAQRYATAAEMQQDLEDAAWQLRQQERRMPDPFPVTAPPQTAAPQTDHPRPIPQEPTSPTFTPGKHPRKKFLPVLLLLLFLLLLAGITTGTALWVANSASDVSGSQCDHSWQEATCTSPKTCTLCSKTSGKALGHNWLDATCTDPKTCTRCGETTIKALGHNWVDANCTDPRTCTACGLTEGEALGHNWDSNSAASLSACQRCGYMEGDALLEFSTGLHSVISAGRSHTVAVRTDGTVLAAGSNYFGQSSISGWRNIVSLTAGCNYTVGLQANGTVVATGSNAYKQCDVSNWENIIAVDAGLFHTVGLKSDGTVIATGWNAYQQCDVARWEGIVAISVGNSHTVGLKSDGTVVAIGSNDDHQCEVSEWTDIIAISAADAHTVGLKKDGTVVYAGSSEYIETMNPRDWRNVIAVNAGSHHIVGLKKNGTVLAIGMNTDGQCDVSEWKNVVAISAGRNHTVALLADGTAVATGLNQDNQCNISDWKNILVPQ